MTAPTDPNGPWYDSDSPWRVKIPAKPTIHPNQAKFALGFKYVAGETTSAETAQVRADGSGTNPFPKGSRMFAIAANSVPSVGIAQATTPNVTVRINYPADNVQGHPCPPDVIIPIPSDMPIQANGMENSAVLMLPRRSDGKGPEVDFFKITKPGVPLVLSDRWCWTTPDPNKWTAVIASVNPDGWTGSGFSPGYAYRENGTNGGAGLIRRRDFDMKATPGAVWDHALALAGGPISAGGGAIPPNVQPFPHGRGDDNAHTMKTDYCVPYSARFWLDTVFDVTTLNVDGTFAGAGNGNAPEWWRQWLRTFQVYGAYPVDSNSDSVNGSGWVCIGQYPDSSWGLGSYNDLLPSSLWRYLRVLDWNDRANYSPASPTPTPGLPISGKLVLKRADGTTQTLDITGTYTAS